MVTVLFNESGEETINCDIPLPVIVIGEAYPIDDDLKEPPACEIIQQEARTSEIGRLKHARNATLATYMRRFSRFDKMPIESQIVGRAMMEAEKELVAGADMVRRIEDTINKQGLSAELATYKIFTTYIKRWTDLATMQESAAIDAQAEDRKEDAKDNKRAAAKSRANAEIFKDLAVTYLQHLDPRGQPAAIEDAPDNCLPVMSTLPTSILPYLYSEKSDEPRIHGMTVFSSTRLSHSVVIAGSSGIAIAMPHKKIQFKRGEPYIIDGHKGIIIKNPSEKTLAEYTERSHAQKIQNELLVEKSRERKKTHTRNGISVKVGANIGFSNEIRWAVQIGAEAIDLVRTELPFIGAAELPDQQGWYEIFSVMAKKATEAGNIPITFRVVDFEGDKRDPLMEGFTSEDIEECTRSQIVAALRVKKENPESKIHILIPSVSTLEYINGLREFFDIKKKETWGDDTKTPAPKFGCMLENPGIILKAADIRADFFSDGTNDMIPNILGYNRYDLKRAGQYDPTDSSVIDSLEKSLERGGPDCPVSLCGALASDVRYIPLLLGLGFRKLSAGVNMVPFVKEMISRVDTAEAHAMVAELKAAKGKGKEFRHREILDRFNAKLGIAPDGDLDMNWTPPGPTEFKLEPTNR